MKKIVCSILFFVMNAAFVCLLPANKLFEDRLNELLGADMKLEGISSCKNLLLQVKTIATIILFCALFYDLNNEDTRQSPIFLELFGHPYLCLMLYAINSVDDMLYRRKCDILPVESILPDIAEIILNCSRVMLQIVKDFKELEILTELLIANHSRMKDNHDVDSNGESNLSWKNLQSGCSVLFTTAMPIIFKFTKKREPAMDDLQLCSWERRKKIIFDILYNHINESDDFFVHFQLNIFEEVFNKVTLSFSSFRNNFEAFYQEFMKRYAQNFVFDQLVAEEPSSSATRIFKRK